MDDDRDPRDDEKETLGQTAAALRRSKNLSQKVFAKDFGVSPRRVSKIEAGEATPELIQEIARKLDYRTVHVLKTVDLFEFLRNERRKPFDPLGPTPEQEIELHEISRRLGAQLEAVVLGRIRRERLEEILNAAAGQWEPLKGLAPAGREAEVRGNAALHSWGFCLYLCEESVRQASDDLKEAVDVARLAVVAARCCVDLPWMDRLIAYAVAHLANAWRVLGRHDEAEKLFAKAHRLWNSPAAAKADPGVLDPGRIYDLEASLRKDQRQCPEALGLLEQAYPISRVPGRILVNRANVLSLRGSYEQAIATLRQAAKLLAGGTNRDKALIDYNMGVNCCHLGRFSEAAEFAASASKVLDASKNRIDILRCRWLRARVLDGQGDRSAAETFYRDLIEEFQERNLNYDLALVTLELAAVLLALGQTRECRALTAGLSAYFEAKRIYPEALAALKLFSDSVYQETATEALARQVAAFLYLAQGTPGLRFLPGL